MDSQQRLDGAVDNHSDVSESGKLFSLKELHFQVSQKHPCCESAWAPFQDWHLIHACRSIGYSWSVTMDFLICWCHATRLAKHDDHAVLSTPSITSGCSVDCLIHLPIPLKT